MNATILKTKVGVNGKGGIVGKLVLVKCHQCGKEWWISYSRVKNGAGKHCSQKCYAEYQKTLPSFNSTPEIAKKISLAKGNKTGWRTSKKLLIRASRKYREWRKAVYERDNYICQWCGERGCRLNADHIKSFASYPELRFEVSNGRTLCVDCHKKTENYLVNKCRDKLGRFAEAIS